MVGLSFAAIPLYRVFCAVTGYGGTPQIGPAAAPGAATRTVTVRFNADTNPGLPWQFAPAQAGGDAAARGGAGGVLPRAQPGADRR